MTNVSTPDPQIKSGGVLRSLAKKPLGAASLIYLLLVLVVAVLAPVLAPWDPNYSDLAATNAPPLTPGHFLGVDNAGLDILSRLIWGARQSLIAIGIILLVSLALGVTSGLIAGFYRGRFEVVSSFIADVIMSLPGVVLLIALYARTGPNIAAAMAVFGIIVAPTYYRLVRAIVHGVRNELYVDAARVVGLSDFRIVGRHILWAVRAPVIIQSSFIMAAGIGIEAGVTFLGLGDPASASWGIVLQRSFTGIYNNAWAVLWPSLVISITILALILLGNALSDVLQASARSRIPTKKQRAKFIETALASISESSTLPATESSSVPLLSVRGLRIGYATPQGQVNEVVHGVNLDLRVGEVRGLVGESGSGKSQMAFSILGILPREALILGGQVLLEGEDLMGDEKLMRKARGRRIAYIPQEPMSNLDPSFTVGAQLIHGLRAASPMSKDQARLKLLALLDRVGIQDPPRIMRMYPHEISGGMAQRVLICGAVAAAPDIIIADEPTTALDVTVQAEVLELMRELTRENGMSMLLVTHNLGVVADICDSVSVMKDGNIVEQGSVDEIFSDPKMEYTKELLASSRAIELKVVTDE